MIKRYISLFVLVSSTIFFMSCSVDRVAGGSGSDIGNGNVIGYVYLSEGVPAANTQVKLVPTDYNPITDSTLPDYYIDTTNKVGMYTFYLKNAGDFNVEAVHLDKRTRFLHKGISIQDIDDTITLPFGVLKQPGTIVVYLADIIDTADSYVFIRGTTHKTKLSKYMMFTDNENTVILDSIPEATIENVYVHSLNDPLNPKLFIDTVFVYSNKVTEIDGFVFYTNYLSGNSGLPNNTVNDIYIDPIFKIWFATNGGVGKLDYIGISSAGFVLNNWTVFNTANSEIPSNSVVNISYMSSSKLIFSTLGGYSQLMGSTWNNYTTQNSDIPTDLILDVDLDSDYCSWVSTMDKGLLMFDGSGWTVFDTANSAIPSNTVLTVRVDAGDTIWSTTPNHIWKFKDSGYSKIFGGGSSGLISDEFYCMSIDSDGYKWFGREGGVSRLNEADTANLWTTYTSYHSGVFTDSVLTIVEDKKGVMWFGTSKGMTKFDGTVWHDFTGDRYRVLNGKGVRAIAFDIYGNTWVGTTEHGVIAFGPTIK